MTQVYNKRHQEDLKRIQELQGATAEVATLRGKLKEVEAVRTLSAEHRCYIYNNICLVSSADVEQQRCRVCVCRGGGAVKCVVNDAQHRFIALLRSFLVAVLLTSIDTASADLQPCLL
jgi:hypothetical protein